ncbi:MAG: hypothetical protein ACRC7G_15445 [Beijerinckiaceae bacterium]
MLEILKRIQEQLADHSSRFDRMDQRFDRLEELSRKQRRDMAGVLVMMKATAGSFDERVEAIEARVTALEAQRS